MRMRWKTTVGGEREKGRGAGGVGRRGMEKEGNREIMGRVRMGVEWMLVNFRGIVTGSGD